MAKKNQGPVEVYSDEANTRMTELGENGFFTQRVQGQMTDDGREVYPVIFPAPKEEHCRDYAGILAFTDLYVEESDKVSDAERIGILLTAAVKHIMVRPNWLDCFDTMVKPGTKNTPDPSTKKARPTTASELQKMADDYRLPAEKRSGGSISAEKVTLGNLKAAMAKVDASELGNGRKAAVKAAITDRILADDPSSVEIDVKVQKDLDALGIVV